MLTLTCGQDHIFTENVWFVCSETSYSGDCTDAGKTTNEQLKIELLSQWKLEAESRNSGSILSEEAIVVESFPPLKLGVNHLFCALTPSLHTRPCVGENIKGKLNLEEKKAAGLCEIGLQSLIVGNILFFLFLCCK